MLVDAERLLSAWLRDQDEITALVADRVYTAIPASPTWPLVRLTRIGGAPVFSRPLHLDRALIQFDVFGGPKVIAWEIAETCRAALSDLPNEPTGLGVITGIQFLSFLYVPDTTYTPARPRYVFDAAVYTHP